MFESYIKILSSLPAGAVTIITIAFFFLFGYGLSRVTRKFRLPDVVGYILAGIMVGPYVLNLAPATIIGGMDFLADIALALVAFSASEFFKLRTLKQNGWSVVFITFVESYFTSALIFVVLFLVLGLKLSFSLVLGALAAATAPASTLMTIRQTKAKGDFVNTLLQVVALDDLTGLLLYSVAISLAVRAAQGQVSLASIFKPLLISLLVMLIGAGFGFLMKLLMPPSGQKDNRLIIAISMLFSFCGICTIMGASPLLGCMSMGTVYINLTEDDKLFKQLNYFSPPILLLFFVHSGASFRLDTLVQAGSAVSAGHPLLLVGVLYFFVRMIGKYVGSFISCKIVRKDAKITNNLGFALFPQAGVAIGLAAMGARAIGGTMGADLQTIILSSSVLYELLGPAFAKFALYRSGAYAHTLEAVVPAEKLSAEATAQSREIDLLIARIQAIQKEIRKQEKQTSPEEKAYNEGAQEWLESQAERFSARRRRFRRY